MDRRRRDDLIRGYEAARAEFKQAGRAQPPDRSVLSRLKAQMQDLLAAYWRDLPRVPLSRCPICTRVLERIFDPAGIDGYWWQEGGAGAAEEPAPCEHFGVLQGAVHLNGLPPLGGMHFEAFLGPEVPFVIPRLLAHDAIVAVISSAPLACGYTAYPIAYFSREALPPSAYTQPWTRSRFSWPGERGRFPWRADTDRWDFELGPWIERRKVLWIEPGDAELRLRRAADAPCPYLGLPGRRERLYVLGAQLRTTPPPQGELIDPSD